MQMWNVAAWKIRCPQGHLFWSVRVCLWASGLSNYRWTSVHQVIFQEDIKTSGKRTEEWLFKYVLPQILDYNTVLVCVHTCRQNTAFEAAGQWTWRWQSSSEAGPWQSDGTCPRSSGRPNAEKTTPSSGPPSLTADSEHGEKERGRKDNASHSDFQIQTERLLFDRLKGVCQCLETARW